MTLPSTQGLFPIFVCSIDKADNMLCVEACVSATYLADVMLSGCIICKPYDILESIISTKNVEKVAAEVPGVCRSGHRL